LHELFFSTNSRSALFKIVYQWHSQLGYGTVNGEQWGGNRGTTKDRTAMEEQARERRKRAAV